MERPAIEVSALKNNDIPRQLGRENRVRASEELTEGEVPQHPWHRARGTDGFQRAL